jgi:competence protein ComFC
MTTDTLLQKVVEFTTPTTCLLCSAEPKLLCNDCFARALPPLPPQTPMAVTTYDDSGKELIRRFKFEGDQEAGRLCARYMASIVRSEDYDVVVAVTTTPARRRQRGYDQSELLARWISKHLKLPYTGALIRIKNVHQIGAGRALRLQQSEGLYAAVKIEQIRGQRILLIDDVITTGATIASATETLFEAGAQLVEGLAFAQDMVGSK